MSSCLSATQAEVLIPDFTLEDDNNGFDHNDNYYDGQMSYTCQVQFRAFELILKISVNFYLPSSEEVSVFCPPLHQTAVLGQLVQILSIRLIHTSQLLLKAPLQICISHKILCID